MDVAEPYAAVCPTLDGPVLAVLASTTRPMTGREVARLARRGSWPGVRRVLHRLVEQGLVHAQEAGTALLYTLNRDHLAAPAVDLLVGMRAELIHRLRSVLGAWAIPPAHASLFGSTARGDGSVDSDVDLFVVRPRRTREGNRHWRSQLDSLPLDVKRWTGNHAAVVEIGESDLPTLRRSPLLEELRSDGIVLVGRTIEDLVRSRR